MKNILFKPLTCLLGLFISAQLYPQLAQAQISPTQILKISPVVLKVQISPGTVQTYKINVENLLETPLPLRVSVEDFDSSDDEDTLRTLKPRVTRLASWITLNTSDVIIEAKRTHSFEVRVLIPKTVPIGGYGAVIFFSPILASNTVNTKVGAVLLANVGLAFDQKNNGEIVQFSFNKSLYQQNPVSTTIRVKNTSLNYFTAKPILTIKPLFGEAKIFELEEKTILPGKVRRWEKTYDFGSLYCGVYRADLTVSLEKGDFIYSQTYFFGFPVVRTLGITLIVGLTLYGGIFRTRVKKALQALFRKT